MIFLWTLIFNIECLILFVWSETVLESILGIRFCCQWSMSFVYTVAIQTVVYWFDLRFFCFMIFWTLYILCRNGQLVDCSQAMLFEGGKVYAVCVFVLRSPSCTLHSIVTTSFWSICDFFWISYHQYRVFDIVCLERDCLGVDTWYPLLLSMNLVIRWDRSPYSGVILIDLRFFWSMLFLILYILWRNGQLVDYAQDIAFEEDTVQVASVFVLRSPSCSLHFIVTMSFWSICDFFLTHLLTIECWKWFIWSETVFESIVGIPFCCQCCMSFMQSGVHPNRHILTRSLIFLL